MFESILQLYQSPVSPHSNFVLMDGNALTDQHVYKKLVYCVYLYTCTLVSSELGRLRQALPAGAGQPDHR